MYTQAEREAIVETNKEWFLSFTSLASRPSDHPECQAIYEACLELERQGLFVRQAEQQNYVIWKRVKEYPIAEPTFENLVTIEPSVQGHVIHSFSSHLRFTGLSFGSRKDSYQRMDALIVEIGRSDANDADMQIIVEALRRIAARQEGSNDG